MIASKTPPITADDALLSFLCTTCPACGNPKRKRCSVCRCCYRRLGHHTRNTLWEAEGTAYLATFRIAMNELDRPVPILPDQPGAR